MARLDGMTPKKRHTFWIDDDQLAALQDVRVRDGVLPSEQIRRALDDWFKKKGVMKADRKRVPSRKRP